MVISKESPYRLPIPSFAIAALRYNEAGLEQSGVGVIGLTFCNLSVEK